MFPRRLLPLFLLLWSACSGGGSSTGGTSGSNVTGICTLDTECPQAQYCRGGVCASPECSVNTDCLSPLVCVDRQCVTNSNPTGVCMTSDQCPPPYLCDGFSHRCVDPNTGEVLGGSSSRPVTPSQGAGSSSASAWASSQGTLPSSSSSRPSSSSSRASSRSSSAPPDTATITCTAAGCVSSPSPLGTNVTASAQWSPCDGGPFSWVADGDFETDYDVACVGGTATAGFSSNCSAGTLLTGLGPWRGDASGTVTVSLATDGSYDSAGLTSLVATCGGASTTATLTCTGLSCSSAPSPLPSRATASTTWNPCMGGPFTWNATGDFESGFDRGCVGGTATATSTGSCSAGTTLSGSGPWSGSATGSITVSLATDGAVASGGLTSLTATCTVPPGIHCTGTTCASTPNPLPGNSTLSTSWNPCQGGAFTWTANGQFESGYDRACVGGTATSGFSGGCSAGTVLTGTGPWTGSATGTVVVSLATDGTLASTGLTSLVAVCAAGSSSHAASSAGASSSVGTSSSGP